MFSMTQPKAAQVDFFGVRNPRQLRTGQTLGTYEVCSLNHENIMLQINPYIV